MRELPQQVIAKLRGPCWEQLRGQFMQVGRLLLAASPGAATELLTTYVKFTTESGSNNPVYAAIWHKNSKRLIVGLALPEEYDAPELGPALPGTTYKGLTKYFILERGGAVPKSLAEWARVAYQNAATASPWVMAVSFVLKETPPGPLQRAG
jgi:hypothetical protein